MTSTRLALLLPLLSLGCASVAFRPSVQSVGEYKNTSSIAEKAEKMPEDGAEEVKVLIESLPEGMAVKEGEIVYDKDRYDMLGKVGAEYKDPSGINMGLWFYGYKESESWRTGLCAWQVPLSWVTLTLWSWFVPTYYPCRVTAGDEEDRRAAVVETMQRATKALGGNLVVIAGFGGINFITVNSHSGAVVGANSVGTLSGVGYAFKVKGAAPPATNTKGGVVSGTTKL
jgi:hypothetical protein